MATKGRKNFGEELQILRRYSDLAEPYFKFLKEKVETGTEKDKWEACKLLRGAFEKMIPQDITSGGEPLNISYDKAFNLTRQTTPDSPVDSTV